MRRITASPVYGSRTSPEPASSKLPKSSRSSNSCTQRAPSAGGAADGLDFGVLVEAGDAVLAPDAARLVAAERYVGAVGCGAVEADEARAQPARDRHCAIQRARHDVAGEPVDAVIGDLDRVLLVLVRDHHEDGTEDLLLRDRHGVVDVDEQRRLDPEARVAPGRRVGAADEQLGALVDALLDVAEDAPSLLGRDHRAAQRAGLLRITRDDAAVDRL